MMPNRTQTPSNIETSSAYVRSRFGTTWFVFLGLAVLAAVAVDLALALHPLKGSWDDGSITAAFARTWAKTGRIALTPTSTQVEGYSSTLWFLLLSVPALFSNQYDKILVWMKVLSAACLIASLALIYVIARAQFMHRRAIVIAVLLVSFSTACYREVRNGMEMNLDGFLLLLLFWLLLKGRQRARIAIATLIACLLILTRFESPFQLTFLMAGMFAAAKSPLGGDSSATRQDLEPLRTLPRGATVRELVWICALTVVFFFLVAFCRHHTFGLWMPNTVYAKQHAPYTTETFSFKSRWNALIEPLRVLIVPVVAAVGALLWSVFHQKGLHRSLERLHPAIWTLSFGCFFFGAIFGANWGYPGRMVLPMLAFVVLAAVAVITSVTDESRLTWAMMVTLLVLHAALWLRVVRQPTLGITTRAVEQVGTGADSIRVALHKEHLLVMLADVGASTLCCQQLTVIDAAFLADPTLSHTGFAGMPTYFRLNRPELVEVQSDWADKSGLYSQGLLDDYSIVAAHGIRYFLRNDLYKELVAEHPSQILPVERVPACQPPDPADLEFSLRKKTCLALNDTAANNNYP